MTVPECLLTTDTSAETQHHLLIAKDRRTGMTFAAGGDPHAARLLAKWIGGLGCQAVTVRTYGEPSICELVGRVRELRAEGTTIVDEISPPGDSAANGIAERAILTFGGLLRTTLLKRMHLRVAMPARVEQRGWCTMLLK